MINLIILEITNWNAVVMNVILLKLHFKARYGELINKIIIIIINKIKKLNPNSNFTKHILENNHTITFNINIILYA